MSSDQTPEIPDGDPPQPDRSGARWPLSAAVAGVACLAIYAWLEGLLPRGPQEFAYFPFMTDPLPFAPMRGFTFEQLVRHLGRTFMLGPALLCLAAAAAAWKLKPPDSRLRRTLMIVAVGVSLLTMAIVMARVLKGRAIIDDELVYRQQAELLATGRLTETTVPPWGWEVFTIWARLPTGEFGATGKYLFGEPLIQIAGTWFGLPALLHLLLAPLALWAWYRVVDADAGTRVAFWATILVAISPMFILTNALALSHTTTLTCLILAGLGFQWACRQRPVAGALLCGTALGFGLTVRPQVVVPMGMVLGLATLYQLLRRRHMAAIAALIGSGSLWLILIALYNRALSGSPFMLPWYLFKPIERFGFGQVGGVEFIHTPWTAIENLVVVAIRFNGWWLGWPLSLGLVLAWWLLGRPRQGVHLWLLGGAAIILLNVPYYSPGVSETGPVYYFELLLPAAILGGHAIARGLERWPRAASAFLLVHFALGTTSFLWENVARLDRLVTTIHSSVDAVMEQIEPPALLIHESHWSESMRFGWVWSFPKRFRSDDDPIVTYPRGPARFLPNMLARYEGRECWYFRFEPPAGRSSSAQPQLSRCEDAMDQLRRPRKPGVALRIASTAERLGMISPRQSNAGRRQLEENEVGSSPSPQRGENETRSRRGADGEE